jgi:alpha-tubulin suppressor-like RCC1 family protein
MRGSMMVSLRGNALLRGNARIGTRRMLVSEGEWLAISLGGQQGMGIQGDGTLWIWGSSENSRFFKELGAESTNDNFLAWQVGEDADWKTVSQGTTHAVLTKKDGSLWFMGGYYDDQIPFRELPVEGSLPYRIGSASNWTHASAGVNYSMAVNASGELWAWGENASGQLGLGSTDYVEEPTQLSETGWSKAFASDFCTIALKSDGTVWSCGQGATGQPFDFEGDTTVFQQIDGITNCNDVALPYSSDYYGNPAGHVLALCDGQIFVWGNNINGQLGLGEIDDEEVFDFQFTPVLLEGYDDWTSVGAGKNCSYAIRSGQLWSWGENDEGKLANGYDGGSDVFVPTLVSDETDWKLATGSKYGDEVFFGLKSNGQLWFCGEENLSLFGQSRWESGLPMGNIGYEQKSWTDLAVSRDFCYAIDQSTGKLFSWGSGSDYRLGLGDDLDRTIPSKTIFPDKQWISIAAGEYHFHAVDSEGNLWGIGDGGIGTGDQFNRSMPTIIQESCDWQSVFSGPSSSSTLGIKQDGSLWGWGSNYYGQLGLGNTVDVLVPTLIDDENQWVRAAVGPGFVFAIKSDGTLWAAGRNSPQYEGDLEFEFIDDSGEDKYFLTQVGNESDWIDVSAYDHIFALKQNGSLWAWGRNSYGQLGIESEENFISVVDREQVSGIWNSAAVGLSSQSIGVKSNGTLWAWGSNENGQLGLSIYENDLERSNFPLQIGEENDWSNVKAAENSYARKSNNKLWSWGKRSSSGALGIGAEFRAFKPIAVTNALAPKRFLGGFPETGWQSFACAGDSWLSVRDGKLWFAGSGAYDGIITDGGASLPIKLGFEGTWVRTIAGYYNHLAFDSDNRLWVWGENYGALGIGEDNLYTTVPKTELVHPESGTWSDVSVGEYHGMAIDTDGKLWGWGDNYYGQLGLGSEAVGELYSEPVLIDDGRVWSKVCAGPYSTFVFDEGGNLWACGQNLYSSLGLGASFSEIEVVDVLNQIDSDGAWDQVASDGEHTVAVDDQGRLWMWGRTGEGELNEEFYYYEPIINETPFLVNADETWTHVVCSAFRTVALSNGKLHAVVMDFEGNFIRRDSDGLTEDRVVPYFDQDLSFVSLQGHASGKGIVAFDSSGRVHLFKNSEGILPSMGDSTSAFVPLTRTIEQ